MNYLIFDTETSDLPNPKIPLTARNQGRIIQLAWLLLDQEFNELDSYKEYLKINGEFDINPKAAERNGITAVLCDEKGVDRKEAMARLLKASWDLSTDTQVLMIAFNLWFDSQLVTTELQIAKSILPYDWTKGFCPMLALTPICKLPHPRGWKGKYKWPKLQEAHVKIFGHEFEGAHDALADVRATARLFRWLVENGHYKPRTTDNERNREPIH